MAIEQAMELVTRLLAQAQALSALTARLRLSDGHESVDPALAAQLERVVAALGANEGIDKLTADERAVVIAFARSYFRQAFDLIEHPDWPGAWLYDDPALLQAQGAASAVVASLFVKAGLGKADARILDIGTGVGRLAIAFCGAYPQAKVVGIDPWEPALVLAHNNVREAGLEDRITLLSTPIEDFEDAEGFDLVWLPSFFIPEAVLDAGLTKVFGGTRPGATVVIGVGVQTGDELADSIDDLVTLRTGGALLSSAEATARLSRAGFVEVQEVGRIWKAPLRLVTGRKG